MIMIICDNNTDKENTNDKITGVIMIIRAILIFKYGDSNHIIIISSSIYMNKNNNNQAKHTKFILVSEAVISLE